MVKKFIGHPQQKVGKSKEVSGKGCLQVFLVKGKKRREWGEEGGGDVLIPPLPGH